MSPSRYALPALLAAALAAHAETKTPAMTAAEFKSVLQAVRPAEGEDRYAQIPWRTNLWEARKEAAKAGKPILLWEMDGHPLGCG
jgi:hypothetical protein